MPTVPPGGKILVSGANGYIAMWVVRKLLEQGYAVRGAVRSAAKAMYLAEYFKSYADKFECIIVEDITKEGAFDEAVKGIDGIEHMASPLTSDISDPDGYIVPAVQGTMGMLKSALKEGRNIKRIIYTSSVAAISGTITSPPRTFTEADWGNESVESVKKNGKSAGDMTKYRASKTLAEQAAWKFYNDHKSDISWDLVALNPPFVVGPTLLDIQNPNNLNASLEAWFMMMAVDKSDSALKGTYGYIHVEDIALAHVVALQKEEAAEQRVIVSSGTTTWQRTRNLIQKLHPEYYSSGVLPAGNPDEVGDITFYWDSSKSKKILGIDYRTMENIVEDCLAYFKSRGWLDKMYQPELTSDNMLLA